MALNCILDRKSLKTALGHAARVTERRNTIPILSYVRIIIGSDSVNLIATDLDMELGQQLPAATDGEGTILVQLETLKATVGKFAGECVRIEDMGGRKALVVCCTSGARAILPTMPDAEWPAMVRGEMLTEFAMPTESFAGSIASALPFVSTEETRYYLNGVFMHRSADEYGRDVIRFAATDGHRMARSTRPLPEGADELADAIIPRKACKVLGALVGKKAEHADCRVAASRAKVEIRYGRFTLLAKLVDGTFPEYSRVIPCNNDVTLTVPASEFAVAVESVTSIATERTRAVAISVSATEGVILTCSSPENGRAAAIFEAATVSDGACMATGFNAKYLAEVVSGFSGDVTAYLGDPAAPVRFEAADRPDFVAVLMPMRIGDCITTRAAVERLSMNPWEALRQHADKAARSDIIAAVDFLATQEPRHVARLRVKAEIAEAKGNDAVRARSHRLLAAYDRQPTGSFLALPVGQFVPIEPTTVPEAVETVAAQGPVAGPISPAANDDAPAGDVVKVLTVTGQAVFVAKGEFANPAQRILQRYNRDGTAMGERVIHRDNIERLVPPRNRGDKPVAVAKNGGGDISERLGRLEYLLESLLLRPTPESADPWQPKRTAAHAAAIQRAWFFRCNMRKQRAWALSEAALGKCYREERDTLKVRCDALERLHAESASLDTAAAHLNGQRTPAIILPVQRTSARTS